MKPTRSTTYPRIATGDVQVCTGVTEPNAGTDTSRIETTARNKGDEYIVNGQKIWTFKAQEADVIMLLTRTEPRTILISWGK